MSKERIIKVFMASSRELEGDRAIFGNLVRRMNDLYKNRIYIKLFQWEDHDSSFGKMRKQSEYDEKVKESDLFLVFFHRLAGKYTIEEFETAMMQFDEIERPKIYIFMKVLAPGEREDESLKEFKERLENELGHFPNSYDHPDTMKLHFVMQFQLLEENRHTVKLEVKDSEVQLDGTPMVNLKNVPFAANNDAFQKLTARKEKLNERVIRYRAKVAKDPNDPDNLQELREALRELDEVGKELEQHEGFLFDLAKTFAQQAGKTCTERMMRARELFEEGKASEANGILSLDDLNRDLDALNRREIKLNEMEQAVREGKEDVRKAKQGLLDEYLIKTKTAMADGNYPVPERFRQACEAYNKAIELQRREKIHVPPEDLAGTLFDYAYLLDDFKHYREEIPVCTEALEIYRELATANPDAYRPYVANTLNTLANLHSNINQYEQAERKYGEALKIYRELTTANPDAYRPGVAWTL
ncbi:MAG: tetratricopeptide repeat protein, partial [Tannerella sp.]|nr:tetratricopeptide repeat protein [Tannerella sp.]